MLLLDLNLLGSVCGDDFELRLICLGSLDGDLLTLIGNMFVLVFLLNIRWNFLLLVLVLLGSLFGDEHALSLVLFGGVAKQQL